MNEANTNTVFLIDTDPDVRETIQELASAMKLKWNFMTMPSLFSNHTCHNGAVA